MRRTALAATVFAVALALSWHARDPADAASTLDRPADPVVITGAAVPGLNGLATGDVVAFRYDGGWQQIPVQVDERAVKSFAQIYNFSGYTGSFSTLVYTDAGTFTGPDPQPGIDADDEIVFMARDAGGPAPVASEPAGVVAASGVQLTITDPLSPGDTGYVYLFQQDGSLDPGASQQYVDYDFVLLSGDYTTTYNTADGPNPENSTAVTPYYQHHFGDRWLSDEARVFADGASGADILDRHKALFAPGQCVRSEDTFDDGEGAFIINKSGPVRAIRSYIGANSGPVTQREHVFYERRHDIRTYLRVHAIPSVMDFFDYSPAASGMTYYNDLNPAGVTVDGAPDSLTAGALAWELVTGAQGSITHAGIVSTNIPGFAYTSYYLDDSTPPVTQCTGDAFAYGSSGFWVNASIPCTDCGTFFLDAYRTMYYDGPGATTALAEQHAAHATSPLEVAAAPWLGAGDSDGDGIADATDNCPSTPNPGQQNNDRNFVDTSPPRPDGLDDVTRAHSDEIGDACDADDDNDGLPDSAETAGAPCPAASAPTSPTEVDTDGDRVSDGAECALGSDPANGASRPAVIVAPDADSDGVPDAYDPDDGAMDADGDRVSDRIEFRGYNTDMAAAETDADGCPDRSEIANVDGNTVVGAADLGIVASGFGTPGSHGNFDIDKNGAINAADLGLVAAAFGGSCA